MHTIIIAEAGVNHNGDVEMAKQLIGVAAKAGADYVKFQTFKADKLVSAKAAQADYQKENLKSADESQLDMLKKLELTDEMHHQLVAYCKTKAIKFLSTGFDLESLDYLIALGIDFFKIPSGEVTNKPYLEKIGGTGKDIVLSTGMCTMDEVGEAIDVLVGVGTAKSKITVLHCNTEYPTPMRDVNLRAMIAMADRFDVKIGYSDHTLGIEVPIAAVSLGACIIEKHFTLSRELPGPDHKASLQPDELSAMCTAIRNIERALGSDIKEPSSSEKKNMVNARKSIHLKNRIKKGELITEDDLIMKRPGDGISPMLYDQVNGKIALFDLPIDHKLNWSDIR